MRHFTTLLLMGILLIQAQAIGAANYTLSVTTGPVTIATGGNTFAWRGTSDDGWTAPVNIFPGGESFTYCGTAFTQMQVSTNGFLRFTSGGADTLTSSLFSNSPGGTVRKIVAPLWDDLAVLDSAADITYTVAGVAPNQVTTISWRNVKWRYLETTPNAEFQVLLYETTNLIDFQYGTITASTTTPTASIGLTDNTPIQSANQATGTFLSLNIGGTAGFRVYHQTMGLAFTSIAVPPDAGTTLRFTPVTVITPLSGTYTVGGIGANFPTVSSAAMALNIHGVSGPVTMNINDGTYDDIFHIINVAGTSSTNTITVKSASATSPLDVNAVLSPLNGNTSTTAPTATTGDAIIRIEGADYVTIRNLDIVDNVANTTATTKFDMGIFVGNSIQNRAVGDTARSGARFNTLSNLFINMNTLGTTTGITGIRFGTNGSAGTDTSLGNSYNTIQDVDVRGVFRAAVRFFGFSTTVRDIGNKVTAVIGRNTIGNSTGASGSDMRMFEIDLQQDFLVEKTDIVNVSNTLLTSNNIYGMWYNPASSSSSTNAGTLTVRNCTISNLSGTNTAHTGTITGIQFNLPANNTIIDVYNNRLYNFSNATTSTGLAKGIVIATSTATGTTANLYNNMVADLRVPAGTSSSTTVNVRGIEINQVITANLTYNTVYFENSSPVTGTTHQSTCLYGANLGTSTLAVKNNIFVNQMGVGTGTSRACAVYFTSAANADKMKTAASDYNLVYAGTPTAQNLLSYDVTNSSQTLADYQTRYSPGEVNAKSKAVTFVSVQDPHLTGASLGDQDLAGLPVAITTDIDGQTRDTQAPYRGADEGSPSLPITLSYFTATYQRASNSVLLRWETISEINNYGFEVQKRLGSAGEFATIANSFIPGHGTTNERHTYNYEDRNVSPGMWYYRLKQIDLDGTVNYVEPVQVRVLTSVGENTPTEFSLSQNYPNPFNPETRIRFALPEASVVTLTVFNVAGQEITTLLADEKAAGYHEVVWKGTAQNGTTVASGLYFYRLTARSVNGVQVFSDLKKMMLVK